MSVLDFGHSDPPRTALLAAGPGQPHQPVRGLDRTSITGSRRSLRWLATPAELPAVRIAL